MELMQVIAKCVMTDPHPGDRTFDDGVWVKLKLVMQKSRLFVDKS